MATNFFNTGEQKIKLKETVRKNISDALAADIHKVTNISLPKESWLPEHFNLQKEFLTLFRKLGGKYIPSSRTSFLNDVKQIIQKRKYLIVLNTSQYLTDVLKQHEIQHTDIKPFMGEADVAIVYADALIAISGSLFLSNAKSHYVSVKNLAKNLLVIAFEENIVATLSEALALQQQNGIAQGSIYEVITPTQLASYDEYSAKEPLIILLLIGKDTSNA